MRFRASNTGFSLIELMVVIVVVAVLTMVAYPAYQSYLIKANRAEAKSLLMDLAQKEQLYFNDTRTFTETWGVLLSTIPSRVDEYYSIAISTTSASPPIPAFSITATPRANTLQEGDGNLTINHSGEKFHGTEPW